MIGVAGVTGLEPATTCVTGRYSNQLSYTPNHVRARNLLDIIPTVNRFFNYFQES